MTPENYPGIYPNTSKENLENWIANDVYIAAVKLELESRSGFKFDLEAIHFMIEDWIASHHSTIYEHAIRSGLITRLRTR